MRESEGYCSVTECSVGADAVVWMLRYGTLGVAAGCALSGVPWSFLT